jgi:N-acyl-D-amino-acid deacylase
MIKKNVLFIILLLILWPVGILGQDKPFDLLITNARVVDGTGNPWFRADVAVKDGRIVKIGRVNQTDANQTIDAKNQILAPGFIDVHTHVESIFNNPDAENFVRMGVTSLITGNCGSSTIDVGKFLGRYEQTPLTVNLGTLIAHGSVRSNVMGLGDREPTPEELEKMKQIVDKAMKDGAVGLSTGLIYLPGMFAKTDEIVALAKVAAGYGGIYATHMRSEGDHVFDAIKESIEIGEKAGLPVEISHFKITVKNFWGESPKTIALVKEARVRGLQVTVDQYAYTASSTSLDVLMPNWALEGGREEVKKRLADNSLREKIAQEMRDNLKRRKFKDYSYAYVASYSAKPEFNGKNIKEITQMAKGKDKLKNQIEQIFDMVAAGGASMVYRVMSEDDVQNIMREPFTMIASDSGVRRLNEGAPHPRGYGNNVRILGYYVRELKILSLEDAIRKMTSLPAQTFNLRDRGLIREGFAADLVIFDENIIADKATFDSPHQYPVGITQVFVNGKAVFADGKMTGTRSGIALRRGL